MAATADAAIQVYASFPRKVAIGPDLNLDPSNWKWVLCLSIPLERLEKLHFSPCPHKWIRYAIGVVVGAEGDLSSSSNALDIVDYNSGLPTESATLYYHTSDDEKRRMFPVEPNIARTNVTSSVATPRRDQFRSNVANRDGNQCVLTGIDELLCDAVHLLAHSKGDTYISTLTERRSRDPAHADVIRDIDSVRNGLFLNKFTHVVVGNHVAFLPTPNFAMESTDVDPTATPGQERCTAHLFDPSQPAFLGDRSAHLSGNPIRISRTPDWPPAILFDAVYASAILHHFGTQALKEVTATWMDTFYPGQVMTQAPAENKVIIDAQAVTAEKTRKQALERQQCCQARSCPDTFDMLLALPYILVPRNELQATFREAKEKAASAEQRRVQDKVDNWKRQVMTS